MKGIEEYVTKDGPRFRVPYKLPGEPRRSKSFPTEREAARFKRMRDQYGPQRALDHLDSQAAPDDEVTVGEAFERWLGTLARPSDATIHAYRLAAKRSWLPEFTDLPVQTLTADDVTGWVQRRQKERNRKGELIAPATIEQELGRLHSTLNDCRLRGEIQRNPADGIKLKRKGPKRPKVITREDFDRLLAAFVDEDGQPNQHRDLVLTLGSTGMRWGEAIGLRWSDVDLDAVDIEGNPAPMLHVSQAYKRGSPGEGMRRIGEPKSAAGVRTVGLYADTVAALRARMPEQPEGLVFPGVTRKGVQYGLDHANFMERWWHPARKAAGLEPWVTPHVLRHSHISWLLALGAPTWLVTRRVGHETTAITEKVYGHWIPDARRMTDKYVALAMGPRQATQPRALDAGE